MFTSIVSSVPNHNIIDDLLKVYSYRGQSINNKEIHDTIVRSSYGEFTYVEITEKLEKISHPNKALSFVVQAIHNPAVEISEEMGKMRIELGLVLKHVT